ncbi:hypothetical protein [Actinocorallia herbida]|uniref:hypothetical protein n=1 Tax=Actinocorallia herbida TaxID=58109 RepID=UPI0014774F72|nr:hypothetical protein [Actinocorallia herbida]
MVADLRPGGLSDPGSTVRIGFERSGALTDLNDSVDVHRQAVAADPADDPDRPSGLGDDEAGSAAPCRP